MNPGLALTLGVLIFLNTTPLAMAGTVTVEILTPSYLDCGGIEIAAQGSDDSLILETAYWAWGDGTADSAWIPATHQYLNNGEYTVTLTLTFETGEVAVDSLAVQISNANDSGCITIARVQLEPAYLMLSAAEEETGQLYLSAWDRNGVEIDTSGLSTNFSIDAPQYATINADTGQVTAVAPFAAPEAYGRLLDDSLGWVSASNFARVRVTKTDLGLEYVPLRGRQVAYYIPRIISGFHLENMAFEYQLVEATDLSYQAQSYGNGFKPYNGHTQYLIVDADRIEDPAEDTLPCGQSGNPVGIGWAIDAINNTYGGCFIYTESGASIQFETPQWTVMFHEMGHNFFGASQALNQITNAFPFHGANYNEGLASFSAMWSLWAIMNCPTTLRENVMATIQAEYNEWRQAEANLIEEYQENGANHEQWDNGVLTGILFDLLDEFGPKVLFDYYSLFYPPNEPIPCTLDSLSDQFGIFAATISASTGLDLRDKFRTDYGFPIQDGDWPMLLSCAEERVAARSYSKSAACTAMMSEIPVFKDGFESLD